MSIPKAISSTVVLAVILAACVPGLVAQDPLLGWKASGNVSDLALIRVAESKYRTTLTFRNISGRAISAVAISFYGRENSATSRYEEWIGDDQAGLANGNSFDLDIGNEEAAEYNHMLAISAVVFEDGTVEGLRHQLDFIRFGRLGKMLETERIKSLLAGPKEQYLADEGIKILTDRVGRSPRTHDDALASVEKTLPPEVSILELKSAEEGIRQSFFQGVQNTRIDMLKRIDQMRQLPLSAKDPKVLTRDLFLSSLIQKYETRCTRYRSMWERAQRGKRHD